MGGWDAKSPDVFLNLSILQLERASHFFLDGNPGLAFAEIKLCTRICGVSAN